jgi:pyruvate, water dikinase
VTEITNPDWEPIMKIAAGIITDRGGRTSHAAIVSRELGIPCIVGTENATKVLKDNDEITIDCSSGEKGIVYKGKLKFRVIEHSLDQVPNTKTAIMVNIGNPEEAFKYSHLPVKGVGLGRVEFIIASEIKIHPKALIQFDELKRSSDKFHLGIVKDIEKLTGQYRDKKMFYVDKLAEGMSKIAAAFYPHEVLIRFSDFKTNEYSSLIGGELYEPDESNPMIGFRGASRYYNPIFKEAFGLECASVIKARNEFGLKNIMPMVPFCRTIEEGNKVLEAMKEFGLDRKKDPEMKVYVMCEIPSNVLQADEFLEIFDGLSIGSNDLTQLTLGLDRDEALISKIGDENDPSVKDLVAMAIAKCKRRNKYIGICGQGPSDFPEFAEFLVENKIDSISLNPDTVIKTLLVIAEKEKKLS